MASKASALARATTSLSGSEKHVYLDQRRCRILANKYECRATTISKICIRIWCLHVLGSRSWLQGLHLGLRIQKYSDSVAVSLDMCKRKA